MALASFLYFSREWDQYKDIKNLSLPLPPYLQGRIQQEASQYILPQRLKMKLLGIQSHTK